MLIYKYRFFSTTLTFDWDDSDEVNRSIVDRVRETGEIWTSGMYLPDAHENIPWTADYSIAEKRKRRELWQTS